MSHCTIIKCWNGFEKKKKKRRRPLCIQNTSIAHVIETFFFISVSKIMSRNGMTSSLIYCIGKTDLLTRPKPIYTSHFLRTISTWLILWHLFIYSISVNKIISFSLFCRSFKNRIDSFHNSFMHFIEDPTTTCTYMVHMFGWLSANN